jgi:hypothetical protein
MTIVLQTGHVIFIPTSDREDPDNKTNQTDNQQLINQSINQSINSLVLQNPKFHHHHNKFTPLNHNWGTLIQRTLSKLISYWVRINILHANSLTILEKRQKLSRFLLCIILNLSVNFQTFLKDVFGHRTLPKAKKVFYLEIINQRAPIKRPRKVVSSVRSSVCKGKG